MKNKFKIGTGVEITIDGKKLKGYIKKGISKDNYVVRISNENMEVNATASQLKKIDLTVSDFGKEYEIPPGGFRSQDENDTDENDFEECDDCDQPDACADFGCAIASGIRKTPMGF